MKGMSATTVLLLVIASSASAQRGIPATVTDVVNPSTVVIVGLGERRLWGVMSPPLDTPAGAEALKAVKAIISRGPLTMQEQPDGAVVLSGSNGNALNYQLVADGVMRHAVPGSHPEFSRYDAAQRSASLLGKGLWAPQSTGGPTVGRAAPAPRYSADNGSARAATLGEIRQKCAVDWPDDFVMRAACEKQQMEAGQKLLGRDMSRGDRATIRGKCTRDWPGDYFMWNACEEQQLRALDSLR
jgi:endonuclease YncB( thermonuclease family)